MRNLAPQTTEERILTVLGTITSLPIKSIRIPKDSVYGLTRGSCFVELHTTLEASQLFTMLSSLNTGFIVDDNLISVCYAKRNTQPNHFTYCASSAASVALAAAQWTNQIDSTHLSSSTSSNSLTTLSLANSAVSLDLKNFEKINLGAVTVNGITYQKYPSPDPSKFQYDESSKYYFDSSTGLYYDANSQYYYNSNTQSYLYWSAENQTYLPAVPQTNQATVAVASTSSSLTSATEQQINETNENDKLKEKSKEKQDKVKIAKKIAKDMEKWAKTLNQKKETSKSVNASASSISINESSASSISNFSTSQEMSNLSDSVGLESKLKFEIKKNTDLMSDICEKHLENKNGDSDDSASRSPFQDPLFILQAEEERLTDWFKLLCLLCKRQFNSKEQLVKHQQASELHKVIKSVYKMSLCCDVF